MIFNFINNNRLMMIMIKKMIMEIKLNELIQIYLIY